nr:uncharacterized protein LOC109147873 [Ipomoea trifida]
MASMGSIATKLEYDNEKGKTNCKGQFCGASVYFVGALGDQNLADLVGIMLMDCWNWCRIKGIEGVKIESNNDMCLRDEVLPPMLRRAGRKCKEKVNCVVALLVVDDSVVGRDGRAGG